MSGVVRSVMIRMGLDNSEVIRKNAESARSFGAVEGAASRMQGRTGINAQRANQMVGRAARNVFIAGAAGLGVLEAANYRFDKQMSAVDAATHTSAANMDRLRESAIELGAQTVFSSSEAAEGIEQLAKAGVSVQDIIGGGLSGALNLAAAGGLGVGESAEYMATSLTQFNLKGTQATHVADLLAAGAGKAQGEVSDMALALSYAGVPAAQLGVSIEETAGAIALFARNGIIGDRAGTGLRGMLSSLTSPSAIAAKTMKRLDISVFDAKGNFIGLDGVAQQLHTRMSGLTQAERSNALGRIFGNQQLGVANVLYKAGAAGVHEWTRKVNDSGYAADTAKRKLNNLAGDVEYLKGDLEALFIRRGGGFQDGLRDIVQGVDHLVERFSKLPNSVQSGIVKLIAMSTAAAGVLWIASKLVGAFSSIRGLFPGRGVANLAGGIAASSRVQPVFVTNWGGMAAAGAAEGAAAGGVGAAEGAAAGGAASRFGKAAGAALRGSLLIGLGAALNNIMVDALGKIGSPGKEPGILGDFSKPKSTRDAVLFGGGHTLERDAGKVLNAQRFGGVFGDIDKKLAGFVGGDALTKATANIEKLDNTISSMKVPSDRLGAYRQVLERTGLSADELNKVLPKTADAIAGVSRKQEQGTNAFKAGRGILNATVRQQQRYSAVLRGVPKHIRSYVSNPGSALSLASMLRLQRQYKLTPRQVRTIMQLHGFSETMIRIALNRKAYNSLPKQVRTALKADTVKARADVLQLQNRYHLTPKQVRTLLVLSGVATARSQIASYKGALGSIQQRIYTDVYVRRHGGGAGTGSTVHIAAEGGPMRAGPGQSRGPKDDSILAAVSHREFVQPVASVDYYGDAMMEAIRRRTFPRAVGLREGGFPTGQAVSQRVSGYGGGSGLAGEIARALRGMQISGTLQSEFGPQELHGYVTGVGVERDDMAGMRRRAGAPS